MPKPHEIASKFLGMSYENLDERAKKVAQHVAGRKHITRNATKDFDLGQRTADAAATFGGSRTFAGLFAAAMVLWVGLNGILMLSHGKTFDPYPYILLNLFLSMLVAIQAPIILTSQNRQPEKDRVSAEHDDEVNLKAELNIMLLHDKVDLLREKQWKELPAIQNEQTKILSALIKKDLTAHDQIQN